MNTVADKLETLPTFSTKSRRILKGHQGKVLAIDWSADKRHMVSTSQDGKLIVWDAFTSNKEVCERRHVHERKEISRLLLLIEACDYDANHLGLSLRLFSISEHGRLRVDEQRRLMRHSFRFYRGLDNKVTLYPLSTDDEAHRQKKVVATHTNYISACKFMHSDQQVATISRMFVPARFCTSC